MTDVFDTNIFHRAFQAVRLVHGTNALMGEHILISLATFAVMLLWYDDHSCVY